MRSTADRHDRRPRLSAAAVVVTALLPTAGALPAAAAETTGASLAISALDGSCGLRVSAAGAATDEAHALSVSAVTAGTTSPSGRELLTRSSDWPAGEEVRATYSLDLSDYRTSGGDAPTVTVTAVLDRSLTRTVTLRLPDCKVQPAVTPSPQPVRPTPTAAPRPSAIPVTPRPSAPPPPAALPAPAAKPAKAAAAPKPAAAPKRPAAVVAHGGAGLAVLPIGAGPAHPGTGFAAVPPVGLPQEVGAGAAPAPIVAAPAPRTLLEALGVPAMPAMSAEPAVSAVPAAPEQAPQAVAARLVADRGPASDGAPLAVLLVAAAASLGLRRRRHS